MSIVQIVERIRNHNDCIVLPPSGLPVIGEGLLLPKQVIDFYSVFS